MHRLNFCAQLFTFSFILFVLTACNSEQTSKEAPKLKTNTPIAENKSDAKIKDKKTITIETIPKETKSTQEEKEITELKADKKATDSNSTPDNQSEKSLDSTTAKENPKTKSGLMGNIGGSNEGNTNNSLGAKKRALLRAGGSSKLEGKHIEYVSNEEYDAQAKYNDNNENIFLNPTENPLSTFSIDVDTAAYTNCRRWLNNGSFPKKGVVRTEEFINYFTYDYKAPEPDSEHPFSVYTEAANCPWNENHQIIQIGIKGKELKAENRKPSNLIFLIDVSGSMNSTDKLPLLKSGLKMLVNHLGDNDTVGIVVYAGASGIALNPTSVKNKSEILESLESLRPGGSTNGAAGIHLAYELAENNFIKEGNNRIILATDGDFNVGTTSTDQLQTLIEEKRKSGVFLSVLGFGTGNLNDHLMETLANKGNGNYSYIDRLSEAQKVLVQQLSATLFTIAKDVKIQIEFNPAYISYYRLIGYEKRLLAAKDFNNDRVDAGEIGAGHTVTALYEIVPVGVELKISDKVDDLKYQKNEKKKEIVSTNSNDILTLKIRYKKPNEKKQC